MANAFVQGNQGTSTSHGSPVLETVTLSAAPAVGDLLFLTLVVGSGSGNVEAVSDSQGNVWTRIPSSFNSAFAVFWTVSNGAAGAYTATMEWIAASGTTFFTIGEWLNSAGFAFESGTYTNQCLGGCCTFGSITYSAGEAGALALLYSWADANGDAFVSGTGCVQRETGASNLQALGDRLSTANGSNVW